MPALRTGDTVPSFALHRGLRDLAGADELLAGGPALFHFYLFDFTGSEEGG